MERHCSVSTSVANLYRMVSGSAEAAETSDSSGPFHGASIHFKPFGQFITHSIIQILCLQFLFQAPGHGLFLAGLSFPAVQPRLVILLDVRVRHPYLQLLDISFKKRPKITAQIRPPEGPFRLGQLLSRPARFNID